MYSLDWKSLSKPRNQWKNGNYNMNACTLTYLSTLVNLSWQKDYHLNLAWLESYINNSYCQDPEKNKGRRQRCSLALWICEARVESNHKLAIIQGCLSVLNNIFIEKTTPSKIPTKAIWLRNFSPLNTKKAILTEKWRSNSVLILLKASPFSYMLTRRCRRWHP